MTMTTAFLFCVLLALILCSAAFLLGSHLSYMRGYWDAFHDCNTPDDHDDIASIKWKREHQAPAAKS
jgi:hypothetical protein